MGTKDILMEHSGISQRSKENCVFANVDNDTNLDSVIQNHTDIQVSHWTNSLEKVDYYKVNNFSVGDILKSTEQDGHFVNRNNHFLYVQICGTIISKTYNNKKIYIEVHDGSGSITCLLEDDYFDNVKDKNLLCLQEKETKRDNIFRATAMTFSSLEHLSSTYLPKTPESVTPGNIVILEGKLSKHNEKFFVFINKLNRKTMADFIDSLEHRKLFYENYLST